MLVGDYETAAEVAYAGDRLIALELAGRDEEAATLFESLGDREFDSTDLPVIGTWFLLQERPADLIALVEASAANPEDWMAGLVPEPALVGATHFTNLAFALRQLGRDAEADRLLAIAAGTLALHESHGADNSWFWINSAEYAALTGDPDGMIDFLRRAVDGGYTAEFGFLPVTLDHYRGDPRFIELENEVIRRAGEERRKLGMVAPTALAT
jgi:hypothetical protein